MIDEPPAQAQPIWAVRPRHGMIHEPRCGCRRAAIDCTGNPHYFTVQSRMSDVTDLYRALAQIDAIRGQVARGTEFRGYGPATLAMTGLMAFVAATVQAHVLRSPRHDISTYLTIWILTAAVALTCISLETITRARRVHSGLAREMIHSAVEHFLPAILSGFLLTVVLVRSAPQSEWMLPGLWQVVFSLGVFSSCRFLPRQMFAVGVWYLAAGLVYLALGPSEWSLSPWSMGIPFGVGQILVAAVLQFGYRQADG